MLQNREKNFVSCVVYLHNESSCAKGFLKAVCKVMRDNFEKYEIICVNDGCTDDTIEQVKAFLAEETHKPVVSLINLSYYQGVESAMNAGRDLAVGDFLFEFDKCALDFEPELIMGCTAGPWRGMMWLPRLPNTGGHGLQSFSIWCITGEAVFRGKSDRNASGWFPGGRSTV